MTQTPTHPTTETALGPARYGVKPDGTCWLQWSEGFTLHRVRYTRAEVYQERSQHSDTVFTHVHLTREDWQKDPSPAAVRAVREEGLRLAPLLVTPEAVARAAVDAAEYNLGHAERETARAQEAEARARATLEEARAGLAGVVLEGGAA